MKRNRTEKYIKQSQHGFMRIADAYFICSAKLRFDFDVYTGEGIKG